jgi:glycosyltransferase involved in cell wall biosynthesis
VVLADGHDDLPATELPLVVQIHEAGWFEPELRATLEPAFYEHIAVRTADAARAASHVITPSESARQDVIGRYGVPAERVHAVPHGVDQTFNPNAGGGRRLVTAARGGRDAPYVLYAATLHPRKNLAVLRNAMAALVAEGLPHVLAIAGGAAPDRADSSELELAAVAELPGAPDRVVRLGQPTDRELAALMAGADAFCLPSLYEGFGLTVLEAMACGAAVVVSDRGALPELVGDAAVVVEPTTMAVTAALRRLLTGPVEARALAGAAAARARRFTWERTAAGWLAVLRAAAAQSYTRPR